MATQISRRCAIVLLPLLLSACGGPEKKSNEPIKQYEMRGEVVRLSPGNQTAVIKHEKIGDWMEAMTMEFPVRDAAEFARLGEGKRVRATVNVQGFDYWLTGIAVE